MTFDNLKSTYEVVDRELQQMIDAESAYIHFEYRMDEWFYRRGGISTELLNQRKKQLIHRFHSVLRERMEDGRKYTSYYSLNTTNPLMYHLDGFILLTEPGQARVGELIYLPELSQWRNEPTGYRLTFDSSLFQVHALRTWSGFGVRCLKKVADLSAQLQILPLTNLKVE